jgi:foldase protein PrsA
MSILNLGLEDLKKAMEEKKEDPLAIFPGEKITLSSFASQLNLDLLSEVPSDRIQDQMKEILEEMINERLIEKEALSRGYDKVPEVSEKVRQYREGLMENKLYGNYILPDIKVTEEDLRQYFEQNRKEFAFPEKRKVAHIQMDSMDSAKDVLKKLKEGESFENLVKTHSKDTQSSNRGGEIGWINKGVTPPEFDKAIFSLKTGEVSDPVQTHLGFHLVKLLEIQPSQPMDFSQAKTAVEKKVFQKKRDDKIRFWIDKLKAVAKIEMNEEEVRATAKKVEEELSKEMGKGLDNEKDKN